MSMNGSYKKCHARYQKAVEDNRKVSIEIVEYLEEQIRKSFTDGSSKPATNDRRSDDNRNVLQGRK